MLSGDRDAAARLPGSCADLPRTAFATGPDLVFALLQRDAHALGVGQGRTATTNRQTVRDHRRHTNLVRFASSIRTDVIFGKDTGRAYYRPTLGPEAMAAIIRALRGICPRVTQPP